MLEISQEIRKKYIIRISICYLGFLIFFVLFRNYSTRYDFKSDLRFESIDAQNSSTLKLDDFNRVEVKDGKIKFELRGVNAQYFQSESTLQISNPDLKVFRENDDVLLISGKYAKVNLDSKSAPGSSSKINSVILEGDVKVVDPDDFIIESDYADYDVERSQIVVPAQAIMNGAGFEVKGQNMLIATDQKKVILNQDVKTHFYKKNN